jgi:hypothetical protein
MENIQIIYAHKKVEVEVITGYLLSIHRLCTKYRYSRKGSIGASVAFKKQY